MKVSCPACGSTYDLDAALGDADGRRFVDLVAGLHPQVARPLIHYLTLFRPAKTGLRWSRMLSLAQELEPMIRAAQITHKGTIYPAPLDAWAAAFDQLAARPANLILPLKTHGYLMTVLAGAAERVAAAAENQREAGRRHRVDPAPRPANSPRPVSDWREQMITQTQERIHNGHDEEEPA